MVNNKHYQNDRNKRERIIRNRINGDGDVIDSFIVDKGHKDGLEIHNITNTGLIIIYNKESGKLITKLIARPAQIKRYYSESNRKPPKWLLDLAQWHYIMGYNR